MTVRCLQYQHEWFGGYVDLAEDDRHHIDEYTMLGMANWVDVPDDIWNRYQRAIEEFEAAEDAVRQAMKPTEDPR